MTNNSDLIKRLREHVNHRGGPTMENGAWQMMLDAADCLEECDKLIEILKDDIDTWKSVFPDIAPSQVLPDRSILEIRITALEQALLPFAEDAKLNTERQDDAYPGCSKHKVKDLRRALELLEEKK